MGVFMNKTIIGESDFKRLRQAGAYYVDKSLFVEEVLTSPYKIILLTRPRRFGKTLNLNLLYHFFEKRETDESNLFEGLAISLSDVYQDHLSKYPVINLTFKDIKDDTFDVAIHRIGVLIHEVFDKHRYLLQWDSLSSLASQLFDKVLTQKAEPKDLVDSIRILSEQLQRYHHQEVIILIDEYDTPIHAAYTNDYFQKMIGFLRNFLSGAFKDNSSLYKGVITGALRIAKESIFTGLNNLAVLTLMDEEFNTCFGFTISEVQTILDDFGLSNYFDSILKWYDGYNFGNNKILNPWSVMNFIAQSNKAFKPYWLNTASMDMIEEVLTPGQHSLRNELNDLIEGRTIIKPIYENIVFSDLNDKNSELLWSFLLHSGYLTVVNEIPGRFRQKYQLQIPNHEVSIIYFELIEKWLKHHINLSQLEALLRSLTKGDIKLFEKKLKAICLEIMSFHDFAGQPEKVYNALVLGILVWLSDDYDIRSNRESGFGRYDIVFKPKNLKNQGIIIEFKRVEENECPDDVLTDAMKQIDDKAYDVELKSAGVRDILKIAIGFRGKDVYLKSSNINNGKVVDRALLNKS